MKFHWFALLSAFTTIQIFHHNHHLLADGLRIPKENSRPKSKCHRNVTSSANQPKCIALSHPFCLDIKLPYNTTTLPDFLPDLNFKSFDEVQGYLEKWRGAQKLPKCWPILQVALCSLLMPQCDEDPTTGRATLLHRSNVDICYDLVNKNECKFIERHLEDWPTLINCNDSNLYARNCTNELRDLKYSVGVSLKPSCQYPLVPTSDDSTWFKDIGGCAVHCKFPISNPHDQANISIIIKSLCLLGLITTSLAIILFRVNKASSKSSRMAKVIKRCTFCQLLLYIGWSLQLIMNQDVGCSPDGSTLYGQPLVANSCVLSFILTYLPSLSSLFWCAHLGKLCHEKLTGNEDKSPGNAEIDRTLSLFNYGLPLTLFVSVAFLGHIDGHGLYGICTVGQQSVIIKSVFVFAPSVFGTLYGNYYFSRIIIKLALVKTTTMKPSLRRNFIRVSALALLTMLQTVFTIVNYFYEFANQQKWLNSIDDYVGCQLDLKDLDPLISTHELTTRQGNCTITARPSITLYYIEVISTLSVGIVISSWAFYEANYKGLRRKLIDWLEDERDRQRRAKFYLNQEPSAQGRTRNWLASNPDAELDETYHDLIDMTSPTRCAGAGADDGQGIDEFTSRSVDQPLQPVNHCIGAGSGYALTRKVSVETITSSLRSVTLTSVFNSESTSITNNGHIIPMVRTKQSRRQKSHKKGTRTSRDVVNDCKQLQLRSNQQDPQLGHEQQLQQQATIDPDLFMMMLMQQHFNPTDLSNLQSDPDKQPCFEHGICEYDSDESHSKRRKIPSPQSS